MSFRYQWITFVTIMRKYFSAGNIIATLKSVEFYLYFDLLQFRIEISGQDLKNGILNLHLLLHF